MAEIIIQSLRKQIEELTEINIKLNQQLDALTRAYDELAIENEELRDLL